MAAEPETQGGAEGDPGQPDAITENVPPSTGPSFTVADLSKHNAITRRNLAYAVLGLIVLLYIGTTGAWIFHAVKTEDLTRVLVGLSGVQSLGAAIVGFYFGKES